MTTDVDVLGVYSANLNTFTNPLGKSVLLQDKPLYSYGQADGTGYLGVGCILMVCIAFCMILLKEKKYHAPDIAQKISVGAVALLSFVVAVSPVVSINAKRILGFDVPYLIEKVWSNFRCYGRLIWIDVWLLMFAGLIVIGRNFHKRQGVMILSFLILLQCYDLHECFREKYDICHNFDEIIDLNEYDEMKELAADASIKNVVIWRSFLDNDNYDALVPVYVWGVDHGKTLNRFYLARDDRDMFNKRAENALANKDESNLYIFETSDEQLCQEEGLYYKVVGDYIIARSCAW